MNRTNMRDSYSPGVEVDEQEPEEEGTDLEDLIIDMEDEFQEVLNSPNGDLLLEIFEQARNSYEKDVKGWTDFFDELRADLHTTDDEDNLKDILDNYRKKAKLELS